MNLPLQTPVVLIVFNRPETTRRVWECLRVQRPAHLFIVADGPRSGRPGEEAHCAETRKICEQPDWPCEVRRLYAEKNLGCRESVIRGLDWAFSQVERAIILEDDCLPAASFFPFCEELLERYQDDEKVGMISGDNFLEGKWEVKESYYFSRFCHIWGWATWRRAWQKMDARMSDWPQRRETEWLEKITGRGPQLHYWRTMLDDSYAGGDGLNTWDVAWQYANWKNSAHCILPAVNLVKNIGFAGGGTHTHSDDHRATMLAGELTFPLRHPAEIRCFDEADNWSERRLYYGATLTQRIFWSLRLPISLRRILQARRAISGLFRRLPKPHG